MRARAWLVAAAILGIVCACGGDDDSGPDSGGVDASTPVDAGGGIDAAGPDDDGGVTPDDGGGHDAGAVDAGAVDAGAVDAASPSDGGMTTTAPPDRAGPYTVMRSMGSISGGTARAFVPDVPAGTRVPLVILKHGFQLSTSNYAMLAERIASHGFVVIGVDTGGGASNVAERDASIAAITWATSSAPFAARVDGERVAVMGHSRGGKVSLMIAAADPRVDAVLLLDPVNGCGPGTPYSASCPDVTGAAFAGALTVPVGVMGETNNAAGGGMPCAPAAQNYQTIYTALAAASWAVEWTFTGADHMDFTDDGGGLAGLFCPDGPGDDAQIRAAVRAMSVAFMRVHLNGESELDAWLVGASLPAGITRRGP